jgi:hypothetical protein
MTQIHSESTPPPGWPKNVRTISMNGLDHLGVDIKTNELYWDGQKIVTEKKLANYERFLASLATIATCVAAAVEVGRAAGW